MGETAYNYTWESPSNIALVKYWGKKGIQLPANPSISFTLNTSKTHTTLKAVESNSPEIGVEVFVEGQINEAFKPKVAKLLEFAIERFPKLERFEFRVETSNTFPHSSGIASSASGMSALALCICSLAVDLKLFDEEDFFLEASQLSRLGSGSACRSVYGGLATWGILSNIAGSSDKYAIPYEDVHPDYLKYQDTILLIHKGQKSVSSTVGHKLLDNHPFADIRYQEAHRNMDKLMDVMRGTDFMKFGEIIENEALMLHALMMTSNPYFILMQPETLAAIEKIRLFRKQNGVPIAFTLDAGANVHVLYPENAKSEVLKFVEKDLVSYCEDGTYLCDSVGRGPTKL